MGRLLRCSFILAFFMAGGFAQDSSEERLLDGFREMYSLRFPEARKQFLEWERDHPDDARGPASEAAAHLFSELTRLGILEAQFFENDSAFKGRPKPKPDKVLRTQFYALLDRAQLIASQRLATDAKDRHALFATTLAHGLRANYAALVEKNNLEALRETKQGGAWGEKLLAIDPQYYDAYLATGISNYIVGSIFAPVRWILRLGGYSGSREKGLSDLALASDKGRLLSPFAKLLLAVASLRADDSQHAREILVQLRDEFPTNPLFAREIERIDKRGK